MTSVKVHDDGDVPQSRFSSANAGVCRCGAVFDNGNVTVPPEYRGLCGRCAVARGLRFGMPRRH
jgi:hypothetical protein